MNYGYTGLAVLPAVFPFAFAVVGVVGLGAVVFCVTDTRKQPGSNAPAKAEDATVTVFATVRQKRAAQRRRCCRHSGKPDFITIYFVTFESESGEQTELRVFEQDYGRMAEGDRGRLSFRGGRFLAFIKEV